jgi:hypothetical protein
MKRVLVFVLLVVSLDVGIGSMLGRLYRLTLTGERGGLTNYALTKDVDVLVLGSSRAQYHVMPSILREKLSMTAFNAGLKGHDFLYAVMLFDLWKRRHAPPRAILLQVDIESILERDGELEAAQIFAPYLDESGLVREVLYSADRYKRFEYMSRAFRYNGKAFVIARNLFAHPDPRFDGFVAALGTLKPTTGTKFLNALDQDATALELARRPFWDTKIHYLRELAEYALQHQTRLFLLHTPLYQQDPVAHRTWANRIESLIAGLPGVAFVDICEATQPETFARRPDIYSDVNHLNARGAAIFSNLLASQLHARLVISARPTDPGTSSIQSSALR